MASKTEQTAPDKPSRDAFKVKGADVVISRHAGREVLQIDGEIIQFVKSDDGYRLRRDAFRKPAKTLREAAERYLESESPK